MFKTFRAAIAMAVLLIPAFLIGMHTASSQNTPKLHRMVIQVSREDTEGMKRLVPPDVKERLRRNIPLGRFGRIRDIEQCAVFLCSDASRFITGVTLVIDGGLWLRSARTLGTD